MAAHRCLSLAALVAILGASSSARADDHWSQWSAPAISAVGQGATKLGLGVDWMHVPVAHSVGDSLRIAGDFEHMLRDAIGLVGSVGVPVQGAWIAPGTLGLRVHVLPLSTFDPYVGLRGGVAWMRPLGRDARVDPTVGAEVGVAFYYFGLFFLEAGARYDVLRYAASSGAFDLSGLGVGGRSGVDF